MKEFCERNEEVEKGDYDKNDAHNRTFDRTFADAKTQLTRPHSTCTSRRGLLRSDRVAARCPARLGNRRAKSVADVAV